MNIYQYVKKNILIKIRDWIIPSYRVNFRNQGSINFIDIGSLRGLIEPWRSNANQIRFLLNFDPNEKPRRTKNSLTYDTAAWGKNESRQFYITKGRDGSGSSLLRPNYEYVRKHFDDLSKHGNQDLAETWFDRNEIIKTIQLPCRSIDSILSEEFPSKNFHFIKIDAQGAEYNILKGAEEFLAADCLGIQIELYKLPMYEGLTLFDEVLEYLIDLKFQLVKKSPAKGTFLSQHDCLFLRNSDQGHLVNQIRKVYQLSGIDEFVMDG